MDIKWEKWECGVIRTRRYIGRPLNNTLGSTGLIFIAGMSSSMEVSSLGPFSLGASLGSSAASSSSSMFFSSTGATMSCLSPARALEVRG